MTPPNLNAGQAERRRRVVEAALELGAEGGYEAVQMRDVSVRANVALGTIYRYFGSKDHLLAAAMVQWVADLERRVTLRPPKGDTVADRVIDVLRRATRALEREPKLAEAVVTALLSSDPGAAEAQRMVTGSLEHILSTALGDDIAPGRAAKVSLTLGHVWFSALVGWVNGWSGMEHVADTVDVAVHLLLDPPD